MEKNIVAYRFALVLTGLLVLSAIFPTYAVRDVITMQQAHGFALSAGLPYIIFAPIYNILDCMTGLSVSQHIAWILFLFITIFITVYNLYHHKRRVIRSFLAIIIATMATLLLYVAAIFIPRPMISLHTPDDNMLVVVDFHSHTKASHDGRKSFDAEDNRQWHKQSGFDAVFVTDHSTFKGVSAGKTGNTQLAKDGVQLMDGVEVRHMGGHVLALCATSITHYKEQYIWTSNSYGCFPLLVQANPGPIQDSDEQFRQRSIEALEVHDGAPIALENIRNRQVWLDKAKSMNIAIVSGSDNHGWGYAANGWSILRIAGWQQLNANALALAITKKIRDDGFRAVQVVERNMVLPAKTIFEHMVMPFKLLWQMWRQLSMAERLSWLFWGWFINIVWVKLW